MKLGYNTNGFSYHRLEDALLILREIGYEAIGLTLDYAHLTPDDLPRAQKIGELIRRYEFREVVIETGARFLLDVRRKHQPTLISPSPQEREVRRKFLEQAIDLCPYLHAQTISFWSGTATDAAQPEVLEARLLEQLWLLCDYADKKGVCLAFEPEPGMWIDTMASYRRLYEKVNRPQFGLTLDVGHLVCLREFPIEQHLREWKDVLWNIHIEDMNPDIHDHLMFGEGQVPFEKIFQTLMEINYQRGIFVELSRHSHNAVAIAQQSYAFLNEHRRS